MLNNKLLHCIAFNIQLIRTTECFALCVRATKESSWTWTLLSLTEGNKHHLQHVKHATRTIGQISADKYIC